MNDLGRLRYTRLYLSSFPIWRLIKFTRHTTLRIDIISLHPDQIADAVIVGIHRGCTILDVKGAYTKEKKADVFMIISSYELQKVAEIVRKTDPMAFMTVSPIKRIFGKFFKHTII